VAGQSSVTVDFGSTFVSEKTFTVTDAAITATTVVECFMAGDTTANNTANAHIYAGRSFRMAATPASGSFSLDVGCTMGMCSGLFKIHYAYA
jgi:thioredoxin reductase